jgi:hypothetical protein
LIDLAHGDQWVMNLRVLHNVGKFLITCGIGGLLIRSQPHGVCLSVNITFVHVMKFSVM